nr:hypothetical protein AMTR_s00070p00139300 [Ipomoea batatas]
MSHAVRANTISIRMQGIREGFISLCSHPNRQHNFSLVDPFPLFTHQSIPLRSQGAIWGNSKRNFKDIKSNSPHKIILHKILILHDYLDHIRLHILLREGENLVPHRVLVLLKMPSGGFVIPNPNFHIGIKTPCDIHHGEIFGLHDVNEEEIHLEKSPYFRLLFLLLDFALYLRLLLEQIRVDFLERRRRSVGGGGDGDFSRVSANPSIHRLGFKILGHRQGNLRRRRGRRRRLVAAKIGVTQTRQSVEFQGNIAFNMRKQTPFIKRVSLNFSFGLGKGNREPRKLDSPKKLAMVAVFPLAINSDINGLSVQVGGIRNVENQLLVPLGVEILVLGLGPLALPIEAHLHKGIRRALPILGHKITRIQHLNYKPRHRKLVTVRYGREIERTKRNVRWRHGGAVVLGGYGGFLGMDLSTFGRKKLNWGMFFDGDIKTGSRKIEDPSRVKETRMSKASKRRPE